ncbi:glycosyltransferase family 4 protein [Pedobacter frigoris]|uniref:Glycosyltransferase family 4 protein n=1 Tax=Pedobacter frigoris TaxID=2571272 RepID=A0A4U1CN34_9SPHI|nr:glycosyltransferase family 4 protein [Pedobacter frigoris]TKC08646.1 glycosyltransferase family 4 protein [Pedobacter frigoris]
MSKKPVLLFLGLSIFNTNGGIQQVCKSLIYALSTIALKRNIGFQICSLHDKNPDPKYVEKANFIGFSNKRAHFILKVLSNFRDTKTVILGHVHLLPLAFLLKTLSKDTEIIILAHGVEVWRHLKAWQCYLLRKKVTIWAVSSFTKHILETRHKINPHRIHILNNSISPFFSVPDHFHKPRELQKRYELKQKTILLSITRKTGEDRYKGYDHVINAIPSLLSRFPNLHYLICGQQYSDEKHRIHTLIGKLNIRPHVTLLDFIPAEELTAHYLLADLFILPSKKEGFGIVFIEAAACGLKIISGNQDGSIDAMLNGKLGCMVDPDNSTQIKDAIIRNLGQKHNYTKAKLIQKTCLKYFSHKKYAFNVEHLLNQTDLFK